MKRVGDDEWASPSLLPRITRKTGGATGGSLGGVGTAAAEGVEEVVGGGGEVGAVPGDASLLARIS